VIPLSKMTIEERLSRLEKVIKIGADGSVTIDSSKEVHLKAPTIQIEGAMAVLLKGGANVEISGGAQLFLKGGAIASVEAGIVRLNHGSHPVAFAGSQVVPHLPPMMKVNNGNATVLV
jgi:hypothetical protein